MKEKSNRLKAYLAAPIFTERDRNFNAYLEKEILKRCPDLDLYLSQNNASINDKTGCANSADIYVGDVTRLKAADLLITVTSADIPPIGTSYETAYFCGLCEQNRDKYIIALYDDCREGSHTYSEAKRDAMLSGIAENQWPYINLLAVGYIKKFGELCFTSQELINQIEKWYNMQLDPRTSGIYKITNLKNDLTYIGQTVDFNKRFLSHWRQRHSDSKDYMSALHQDMLQLGKDYFKFEIIEKCDNEQLNEREKYWIAYYDSYNNGYNGDTGGSGSKQIDGAYQSSQAIPVYSYNLDGTFDKEYKSIAAAVRAMGLKTNNISRAAAFDDNHHISGRKMWRFKKMDRLPPYEPPTGGKEIFCYDMATRLFIRGYANARTAGIELTGQRQPHINDVANGRRKSCCGFLWSYDYYDKLPENYWEDNTKYAEEYEN